MINLASSLVFPTASARSPATKRSQIFLLSFWNVAKILFHLDCEAYSMRRGNPLLDEAGVLASGVLLAIPNNPFLLTI